MYILYPQYGKFIKREMVLAWQLKNSGSQDDVRRADIGAQAQRDGVVAFLRRAPPSIRRSVQFCKFCPPFALLLIFSITAVVLAMPLATCDAAPRERNDQTR